MTLFYIKNRMSYQSSALFSLIRWGEGPKKPLFTHSVTVCNLSSHFIASSDSISDSSSSAVEKGIYYEYENETHDKDMKN